MKFVLCFLFVTLLLSITGVYANPTPTTTQANSEKYAANIQRAVTYLSNQFNPVIGLVSESPDAGTHWLKRTEFPNYSWKYNETHWLFSDNLFAIAALQPWRSDLSAAINQTYEKYSPPFSNKFESIIGLPVGPDRGATDVIVNSSADFVVLYRIHNGTLANPAIPFADAIIYRSLSEHYLGEQDLAVKDIIWAASLWNGTCVVDFGVTKTYLNPSNAPSDIQWCMNEKVALILFGAQVVGVTLPQFAEMEAHLWKMQNSAGGIVTLATGHGDASGSSNTETTSATLLIYGQSLINQLRNKTVQVSEFPPILIPLIALMSILPILVVTSSQAKARGLPVSLTQLAPQLRVDGVEVESPQA